MGLQHRRHGSTRARRSGATASASRRTPDRYSASTGRTGRSSGASTSSATSSATRASMRAPRPTASASSASPARERSTRSPRQRRHAVDRPRRLARLHDARGRGRPRVRRRLRRGSPRLQREDGPGALAAHRPGRILGAPVVVGKLVFFSTLEQRTYAADTSTGKVAWQIGMGKYSPGIATDRHYYFSLNGILSAFRGQNSPPEVK